MVLIHVHKKSPSVDRSSSQDTAVACCCCCDGADAAQQQQLASLLEVPLLRPSSRCCQQHLEVGRNDEKTI